MMAGIRICGDANYWFESGRTRNVVIRNNRFGTMATGGRSPQAVLQIDPVISHDARSGGLRITDVSVSKETSWSRSTTS